MPNQQTIAKEFTFSGIGLQLGSDVKVTCKPAGPNAGIVFKRLDLANKPFIRVGEAIFLNCDRRRSAIGKGIMSVQTVEHFLAALWSQGINNITIEINGEELPGLDGSALEFIGLLKNAGIVEQEDSRSFLKITDLERIEENGASLAIFPSETFSISYLIDYKTPSIGREVFDIELDGDTFEREVAPARTFCLKREVEMLLKAGFGQGANLKNTLVMDDDGPIGTHLRFSNEPVRHKVLDLVGDLYMLGRPIIGRVIAEKSGHKLNAKMVRRLYGKYIKAESRDRSTAVA